MTELSHDYNVPVAQRSRELAISNRIRERNKFKVLDVCCRRFPRGFGVDLHPESNADTLCDAHDLKGLRDKSFDLTLCVEGIEHLQNPGKAVLEWARVTRYALCVTTQNAHCWRRWVPFKLIADNVCTSPDHIYLWDEQTYANFWRKLLPYANVTLEWYDRYLKKTRNFWPARFFHENILAFVWLHPENLNLYSQMHLYSEVKKEALRLVNFRPENDFEYSDRRLS